MRMIVSAVLGCVVAGAAQAGGLLVVAERSVERRLEQLAIRIDGDRAELTLNANFLGTPGARAQIGKLTRVADDAWRARVKELELVRKRQKSRKDREGGLRESFGKLGDPSRAFRIYVDGEEFVPASPAYVVARDFLARASQLDGWKLEDGVELEVLGGGRFKRTRVGKSTETRIGTAAALGCQGEAPVTCAVAGLGTAYLE